MEQKIVFSSNSLLLARSRDRLPCNRQFPVTFRYTLISPYVELQERPQVKAISLYSYDKYVFYILVTVAPMHHYTLLL